MHTNHRLHQARHRTRTRTGLRAVAATLAVCAAACAPTPAPTATDALAGDVTGLARNGTHCPVAHNFPRVLELDVAGEDPAELLVEVCAVATTAKGGAHARGGFELVTDDGALRGTATGSWTWSSDDVLRVELQPSIRSGSLRSSAGSYELEARVAREGEPASVTGTLTPAD